MASRPLKSSGELQNLHGLELVLDGLLAVGIVMSFATQVSIRGLPVTVGESSLLLWILMSLARALFIEQTQTSRALVLFAVFWTAFAIQLAIGLMLGYLLTNLYWPAVTHDTVSYVLVASITILLTSSWSAGRRIQRSAVLAMVVADVVFAVQIAIASGILHVSGYDFWFYDRFQGFSQNPNQLAIYCALLLPIGLHVTFNSRPTAGWLIGLPSVAMSFYVGRLTKSDAFLGTAALSFLAFMVSGLRPLVLARSRGLTLRRKLSIFLLVASVPAVISVYPLVAGEAGVAFTAAKSLTKDRGGAGTQQTAALRLELWQDAFQKGMSSGSMGLGPGPHLERPRLNKFAYTRTPFEAHNTYIDVYTQAGLLGVALLLWLLGSAALWTWRAGLDGLFALSITLVVFGIPHLIIRHPIFWFSIVLCLVVADERLKAERNEKEARR